jgi:D-alanine--poly(phosphoribitol) ligase subunit 1
MGNSGSSLVQAFRGHTVAHPERLALVVNSQSYSYGRLAGTAQGVARRIPRPSGRRAHIGVLASRTLEAYAGVLGSLWAGAAYVPISPSLPDDRLIQILQVTPLDAVVADAAGLERLEGGAAPFAPELILAAPDFQHEKFDPQSGPDPVSAQDLAYIMFTSGTTGVPKGVMIETGSVAQLIDIMQQRYSFHPGDRVSQVSELTFDVSVFDLLMTWSAGAALFVVPAAQLMGPARFIQDHELTVWFSVPSIALLMQRMRMLSPGAFPSLRYSLFAGESLPLETARAWKAAAPNSTVENLYGPTEATVVCIGQRFEESPSIAAQRGVVAIGIPFEGVQAAILDSSLNPLAGSEPGELALSGRQLARGYFNDPQMTSRRFPVLAGVRWYRTGDLVCRDVSGAIHHLGRLDNQVKVLGNRVELEEVEAHLRDVTGTDSVVALAWPVEDGRASGIVAFLCGCRMSWQAVRAAMRRRVPHYMVPQQLLGIDSMPLGPNGKFDRLALLRRLERGPEARD